MKRFLKGVILYLIPVFVAGVVLFLVAGKRWDRDFQKLSQYETLIMGASRGATILPDSFENAVNLSQLAENYLLTYYKLKNILELQPAPKVRQVILFYSDVHLSSFQDAKLSHPRWIEEFHLRLSGLPNWKGLEGVKRMLLVKYRIFGSFKPNPLIPKQKRLIAYQKQSRIGNMEELESSIKRHYSDPYNLNAPATYSVKMEEYLRKLIQLCEAQDIKLVLTTYPCHPEYNRRIPPLFTEKAKELIEQLQKEGSIQYVDLQGLQFPDSDYRDYDHLNNKGSQIATGRLVRAIN